MNKLTSFLTVLCAVVALPAIAQIPAKPFYIGADIGGLRASYNADSEELQPKDFFVGNINAGWQFHDLFAMELGYFRTNEGSKNTSGLKVSHVWSGMSFDVVGAFPIMSDRLSILGNAGLAYVKMDTDVELGSLSDDTSDDTTALKVGTGLQYNINDAFAVRTKIDFLGVNDGLWLYTAGVQYHL